MEATEAKETRERLLDGFADQLLESGYKGISLETLATDVGIQRPSLYHHFPDGKEQLYTEVALRMIAQDAERLQAALATGGGLRSQLVALALLHTDDPRKAALDQRIYDTTRYVSDGTRELVSTRYVDDLLAPVTARMADAVATGELRDLDPGLLMQTFFGMTQVVGGIPEDVAMPPAKRGPRQRSAEAVAEEVVDVFLKGAGAAPSAD